MSVRSAHTLLLTLVVATIVSACGSTTRPFADAAPAPIDAAAEGIDADGIDATEAPGPDADGCSPSSGGTYYQDADHDGYGDVATSMIGCAEGWVTNSDDCDDTDRAIHPGVTEVCDGRDQDCNQIIDDGGESWADLDGDGFGDPGQVRARCPSIGWVANGDDCNDADRAIHPGALEICDAVDQDCDGAPDDVTSMVWRDGDHDGYGSRTQGVVGCPADGWVIDNSDCDDTQPAVHPGAAEVCNGVDDDCSGTRDDVTTQVWRDGDHDGYGNAAQPSVGCPDADHAANAQDCLDSNGNVHPGQTSFFTTSYTDAAGQASFDYDCDRTLTRQWWSFSTCDGTECGPVPSGWAFDAVPYCGVSDLWIACSNCSSSVINYTEFNRPQSCR
jgi:hypothetical protein